MNEPTKSGKRIVSMSAFVANAGRKAALAAYGAAVCLLGIASVAVVSVSLVPLIWHNSRSDLFLGLLIIGILGGLSFALIYLGGMAVKESKEIDAGVPLTRASAAHLPASESLVRASSEPVQEQGTVLLRAAIQGRETPPEEMVRASAWPES